MAHLIAGITVVIEPLLSIIDDQSQALTNLGVSFFAVTPNKPFCRLNNIDVKVLLTTPESLFG